MNLIIQVQGRQAIPVRAIPLLTNWRFMSPDIVAHVIGGTGGSNASLFGDLESHRVENGQVQPINTDWWVQFPLKELQALSKKIKETESIDEVGYSEWRKLSLKELPAGVFVWKDDYQKLHDKNWNDRFRQTYCAFRDWHAKDKMDDPNEAVEAQVQRQLTREELADDHPLRRHLKESLQVLKRWEKPDYSPFIAPEMCAVVMEGFEPLLPTPGIAPAPVAEHDDVDALFERIEEVERALDYWETRDDSKASDAEIKERKLHVLSTEKAALMEKKRLMRGDYTESYQAPQTTTPSPAPMESDKTGPLPLTTGEIAFCFAGLRWDEQRWKKPLGDKPKWLAACIAIPGVRGVSERRWSPVCIGAALVRDGHAKANSVRAKFQTIPLLTPWLDEWKTYEADNFDSH